MSDFVWYDLMTDDCKAAATFYGSVVGWTATDSGMPGPEYHMLAMDGVTVGGLMPIPADAKASGAKPCWSGYVGVDDCDAYAKKVTDAGGAVHRPASDIPGVGRFAVVADPHGGTFILFTPNRGGEGADRANEPGRIGWHELHAGDAGADFDFYAKIFGWTLIEKIDMGPIGSYYTFAAGGPPVGGMITKMPDTPQPYWLYYFNVEGIDGAIARVNAGGGTTWNGPHEVPGGLWVAMCDDPAGASFGLVAPKR